jgi:hypothetical protein
MSTERFGAWVGLAGLGSTLGFTGWVGASAVSPPPGTPHRLRPPPGYVAPQPERHPPLGSDAARTIRLVGVDGDSTWRDRRALISADGAEPRAYAPGEMLPDQSLLTAVRSDGIDVFTPDDVVLRWPLHGEPEVQEDFHVPESTTVSRRRETSAELRDAVLETLELARSGDSDIAQLAFDALLDAGEPVIDVLLLRVASEVRLAWVSVELPDGRVYTPPTEGGFVMLLLEAITGHRVPGGDGDRSSRQAAAVRWLAYLGPTSLSDPQP